MSEILLEYNQDEIFIYRLKDDGKKKQIYRMKLLDYRDIIKALAGAGDEIDCEIMAGYAKDEDWPHP